MKLLLFILALLAWREASAQNLEEMQEVVENFSETVEDAMEEATSNLHKGINKFKDGITVLADVADNIFATGANLFGQGINTIISAGGKVVSTILDPMDTWTPESDTDDGPSTGTAESDTDHGHSTGTAESDTDHGHSTGSVVPCPTVADIIFALDASSSVKHKNFVMELQFAKRITEHFIIGPEDVQFGAVVFSDTAEKRFELNTYRDHASLSEGILNMPYKNGDTKIYSALNLIREERLLTSFRGARNTSGKTVIVITGGTSDDIYKSRTAADKLHQVGITMIVVSVGLLTNSNEQQFITGGVSDNIFSTVSFENLLDVEQKVAHRTCAISTDARFLPVKKPVTCINGFTNRPRVITEKCIDMSECLTSRCQQICTDTIGGYKCSCFPGFAVSELNHQLCVEVTTCSAVADVILILDSSESIGEFNYAMLLQFAAKLIKRFDQHGFRVAVLISGNKTQEMFALKDYSNAADVEQAIKNAPYLKQGRYIDKALDHVDHRGLFTPAQGGRANAKKIIIVFINSVSNLPEKTKRSANKLKNKGVTIMAFGIGEDVREEELKAIASSKKNVFRVENANFLASFEERLANRTCEEANS